MYRAVTRGIQITVTPRYLAERSSAEDDRYFWAYTIEIVNMGPQPVQLKNRHWKITDGRGQLQEVRGPGVVGEQPVLGPGERFEYTSGVPLTTPTGLMAGSYEMVSESGEKFDAEVPAFSLDSPHGETGGALMARLLRLNGLLCKRCVTTCRFQQAARADSCASAAIFVDDGLRAVLPRCVMRQDDLGAALSFASSGRLLAG